jgi:hypothetical protein
MGFAKDSIYPTRYKMHLMGIAEFIIGRAFARPVGSAHPTGRLPDQNNRTGARSRGSPPSRRRLRLVQIGRETILRRWNGIEQHDRADLSAMTDAVGDDMHEHLLAGHAARGAVREREVDSFRQLIAVERRHIIDILPIAFSNAEKSSGVGMHQWASTSLPD